MVRPSTEPSGSASESREAPGAFTEDHSDHDENETDSRVLPSIERRTTNRKGIGTIAQTLDYIDDRCHNLELDITAIRERTVSIDNRLTQVDTRLIRVEARLEQLDSMDEKLNQLLRYLPMTEADQRAANRYPKNPAFGQAAIRPHTEPSTQIVVPQSTAQPSPSPSIGSNPSTGFKLKREDLGMFNPDAEDTNKSGVLTEGRNLIFTDVFSFE
jgi:hypothetical protein